MRRAAELLPQFLADHLALTRRQVEADRLIGASLAGHLVHDLPGAGQPARDRPWRLDPIPFVLDGEVFDELAARVTERLLAMEALLGDLYGPRDSVRAGWVPAEALSSSPRYRLATVGAPAPPRWLTSYAVDVVELADGSWRVVQDLADTPTGVGYALIDRAVMGRVAAELLGPEGSSDLASISGFPADLRHALAATSKVASPRIVVFTGGIDEAAYVEHSSLARLLGFHLVEAPDLVVRKGRLWLRTLGGLDPIDVVYRRLADAAVDPIEVSATNTTGVPGLLFAATEGGVVLANAHGCGVVEDPTLAAYWPAAVEGLTGVRLGLPLLEPGAELATVPAFRESRIGVARAVIRLHAVAGPDGVTVMAGGNGRVLSDGDDPRRPTARLAKDVWVLGADRAAPPVVAPLPQVDLVSSVPTRAADAMFWLGRAAERAEAVAKTARVVASRRQTDPSLATYDGGRWARRMAHVLRVVRGEALDVAAVDGRPIVVLDAELVAATRAVSERLTAVLAEAGTVAEYLSVTAGRVLRNMAESRN
ncbi:MAG TPA: circularly permuted type 2 ATP-grasp protein, partial [Ilumatobacteraceae bacterium]|nr:circularly permuted type 2 ATP-grasp protein [Ilumatobacteraceae bacterium]